MVEPLTLKKLREIAESNLCEKCKPVYSSLIEPNIKSIIKGYSYYWKDIEWRITAMVMKLEGVFKKEDGIIIGFESDDEAKRYADEVNYELWKKIYRARFQWKINYLRKKGILGKSSFELLETLRQNRNKKMHKPYRYFNERDIIEFSYGTDVVNNIWFAFQGKFDPRITKNMRNKAEHLAKKYLLKIQKTK